MPNVFSWILHPQRSSLASVTDEFAVGDFHLRLLGPCLEVEVAVDGTEEGARRLADKYVGLLRSRGLPVQLLTREEFSALPPQIIYAARSDPRGRMIAVSAVRAARSALLAGSDDTLGRCYEYRDQMIGDEGHALFHAHKLIETLENKLGGEAALIRALDMRDKIKYVKRAANAPQMDERHAPLSSAETPYRPRFDRATALKYTQDILRGYEQYLRR
jgi:hypothetical protein